MRFVIDRIEEDTAVIELENGQMLTIPAVLVDNAKEGDAIILTVEEKRVDTHSIFEALKNKSKNNT
ncbi:MAG: DUF3006 domain-containing protein [Ruminococcus sp.]|nr:DUF3006 domain-containing protein [Ruminococcus sp.]